MNNDEVNLMRAYNVHARKYGDKPGYDLTLAQWNRVWEASGLLYCRGRFIGDACMQRISISRPWTVSNVHIVIATNRTVGACRRPQERLADPTMLEYRRMGFEPSYPDSVIFPVGEWRDRRLQHAQE